MEFYGRGGIYLGSAISVNSIGQECVGHWSNLPDYDRPACYHSYAADAGAAEAMAKETNAKKQE